MATRKATASTSIDTVQVVAIALKRCKNKAEYNRIAGANTEADLIAAWNTLDFEYQSRIHQMCNEAPQPDAQVVADELSACGTRIELQAVKATYGDVAVKNAWKLLPQTERDRLTGICKNEVKEPTLEPVTEPKPEPQPKPKTRTLFTIGDDLERLNELLDDCGDDIQQQALITQWFEHLGEERDRKLDNYAGLISEMSARAEVRKAEAKRLMELAQADENRAKMLKDRLKIFFETHNLKTVETVRYKLSLAKNGGKVPLILDDSIPATQLPEQFQRVSVDPDTAAIREALEAGQQLAFAQLGERGTCLRIK